MMKATFKKYLLHFKIPGGTSRGILKSKETYFLRIRENNKVGIGECALFIGLSIDNCENYETKLQWLCSNIEMDKDLLFEGLKAYPSIQFGLEQALMSLNSTDTFNLFPSNFTKGLNSISINGLIWMGDKLFMQKQIKEKLKSGFTTIKLKIGAIDFKTELDILKAIRNEFTADEIELRVDANGAFKPKDALEKLKRLSTYSLHSIEQPIKVKQWEIMASLCEKTPLPIALDEELIGVFDRAEKENMMQIINPQYIILKPSLIGGIQGTDEWIKTAKKQGSGWWITSALESNIGLNAIAQYNYTLNTKIPQGLGTGGLFTNNIPSPLVIDQGKLFYKVSAKNNWDFTFLNFNK